MFARMSGIPARYQDCCLAVAAARGPQRAFARPGASRLPLADSALRGLDSGRAAAGAATTGGLQPPSCEISSNGRDDPERAPRCAELSRWCPEPLCSRGPAFGDRDPEQQHGSVLTSRDGSVLASVEGRSRSRQRAVQRRGRGLGRERRNCARGIAWPLGASCVVTVAISQTRSAATRAGFRRE